MAEKRRNLYPTAAEFPAPPEVRPSAPCLEDDEQLGHRVISEAYEVGKTFAEQGVTFEESGHEGEALEMYYRAVRHLDRGLIVRCDRLYCTGPEWYNARQLQRKILHLKRSMQERISCLSVVPEKRKRTEEPPTSGGASGTVSASSSDLSVPAVIQPRDAELLLHFSVGVQLFFVGADGHVTTQGQPADLAVYTVDKPQRLTWLQVGDWSYPLVRSDSAVLKTGYGGYFFPDLNSDDNKSAIGIIFPAELSLECRELFDDILRHHSALEEEPQARVPDDMFTVPPPTTEEEPSVSQKVSDGLVKGSEYLARGLCHGAMLTSSALSYGAAKLRDRLQPEASGGALVDPRYHQGAAYLRTATDVACKVSGAAVNAVGGLACIVGKQIAKAVAPTAATSSGAQRTALDNAATIAQGGLVGFATVYMGLESAAKILASSLANETVQVVNHKYGAPVGELVGNSLYSVGNLALTVNNVSNLGIRGIAKRTAKEAGKAVIIEYLNTGPNQPGGSDSAGVTITELPNSPDQPDGLNRTPRVNGGPPPPRPPPQPPTSSVSRR